jgi:class 3 adenylate cyclase
MVVFVDVKSYSAHTAHTQKEIVGLLTACLIKALGKTTKEYGRYDRQHREIDFQKGIVKIPTGDGAAIAFSYTEHPYIHLFFALSLLREIEESNRKAKANENKFQIKIGIADDTGIIYKDINGKDNLAGRAINMASRVMDLADANQIMLTNRAYDNLIQIEKQFEGKFECYENIKIKHGFETVWQYIDGTKSCLNTKLRPKVRNPMSLTQSDLENALSPMRVALERITDRLENRFVFLNGPKQIYGSVVEAINRASHNIRIVRLGLRPSAPAEALSALERKVMVEEVTYDIVIVLNPLEQIGGFKDDNRILLEKFGTNAGARGRYKPWVLQTSEPICFDMIIVDNTDVGIGFTHASGVEDLQDAIMFHNPAVAGILVHWFENVIKGNPNTQSYHDWEKSINLSSKTKRRK